MCVGCGDGTIRIYDLDAGLEKVCIGCVSLKMCSYCLSLITTIIIITPGLKLVFFKCSDIVRTTWMLSRHQRQLSGHSR